jgi:glycosyltransferase involved in cell wall biosynthesis
VTGVCNDAVSVVIPTRDRLEMLAQTVHTVLAQEVELEVVVVDEASSDGTAEWLRALAGRDPRVRAIRHERPHGLPAARNAGFAASSSPWVAFVDDDDLWSPDKLRRLLAAAEERGASWAYGGCLDITSDPVLLRVTSPSASDWERLPWVNVVPGGGSNVVGRRQAFEAAGGFDTALPTSEDWDMWIRLAQLGAPAVVPAPLTAYRLHPGNMSKKTTAMIRGIAELDSRYRDLRGGSPLDWDDAYRWLGRDALRSGNRSTALRIAFAGLRSGHPGAGRRLARAVVPVRPRPPLGTGDARSLLDRWRPRPVVAWPPGAEAWVRDALQTGVT